MSHFYSRSSVEALFHSYAVSNEDGTTFDAAKESISNPSIIDLEAYLKQDAKIFNFDISLLEQDKGSAEKKRKLVKRLDDASVGTVRADPTDTEAGSSRRGTRPSP
jgi:hypothetical protein